MRMKREHFEAAVLTGTTLYVTQKLLITQLTGLSLEVVFLLALTVLAVWQEFASACGSTGFGYKTKRADSDGTALGALSLPWCFGALLSNAITSSRNPGFPSFAFRSSTASAAAMLATFAFQPAHSISKSSRRTGGIVKMQMHSKPLSGAKCNWESKPRDESGCGAKKGTHTAPVAVALAVLVAAVVVSPILQGVSSWGGPDGFLWGHSHANRTKAAAGIALNATAGAGGVHIVLTHLPHCFTIGEAMVVTQAAVLLATDVALIAFSLASTSLLNSGQQPVSSSRAAFQTALGERRELHLFVEVLLVAVLLTAFVAVLLLRTIFPASKQQLKRNLSSKLSVTDAKIRADSSSRTLEGFPSSDSKTTAASFSSKKPSDPRIAHASNNGRCKEIYPATEAWPKHWRCSREAALLVLLLAVGFTAAVQPAIWALTFALATPRRVALLCYWILFLAGALPSMDWISRRSGLSTIIVRKGYHILALVLFAPALLLEAELFAISLAIASALLIVVEAIRIGRVPLLGPYIHSFMTSFIDERDAGLLLVSHFSLLIGMAAPVWLCISGDTQQGPQNLAAAFSGIAVLGMADSAASVLGRKFGKHRILGTRKTVEGTLGGVLCNSAAWCLLSLFFESERTWASFVFASVASCLLEAATTQLDNLFLPLHHLALLL